MGHYLWAVGPASDRHIAEASPATLTKVSFNALMWRAQTSCTTLCGGVQTIQLVHISICKHWKSNLWCFRHNKVIEIINKTNAMKILWPNLDDARLLVLFYCYLRYWTSFLCMTLRSQCQGHDGNDLGWVGARHLYLNFDDTHLLVLTSGYLRFLTSFYVWPWDLRVNVTVEMTLYGWVPGTCTVHLMIHDIYF